jgi:ATP-dependent DNA helicase RecG
MRPNILFPLFGTIGSLKGVGPRLLPLYKKLCGEHVVDLLWHLPVGVIDRSYNPQLKYAERDRVATLTVTVAEHNPPRKPKLPYRIVCFDGTDQIVINYFNVKGDYLSNLYPANQKIIISGLLERYLANWSMTHPDYVLPIERAAEIPRFEPVYPLTEGLSSKMLRKTIDQALTKAPELPEWHDVHLMKREKWVGWREALLAAHRPQSESGAKPLSRVEHGASSVPPHEGFSLRRTPRRSTRARGDTQTLSERCWAGAGGHK